MKDHLRPLSAMFREFHKRITQRQGICHILLIYFLNLFIDWNILLSDKDNCGVIYLMGREDNSNRK